MSYTQTFKGEFTYADPRCLEAALDAFLEDLEDVIVDFDDLKVSDLRVRLDYDCSAPASMYDPTLSALSLLGDFAASGRIDTTFHLDGVSRQHVGHGGRRSGDGLPSSHHKWELYFAAKRGDAVALRELQRAGVDLKQDLQGLTALHLAATAGSPEAVALVLEAGVPVDGADVVTPLAVAANAATARVLLDAGAKLDVMIDDESLFAATCDRADVAGLLLDRGIAVPPDAYPTIAETLARTAQIALLRRLIERDPAFAVALRGEDVMACAIRSNDPVLVDFLADHGAPMPENLFETLIETGATALLGNALNAPDAITRCGTSAASSDAMCLAAAHSQLAVMQLLASRGVPIHPAVPGETSPVHAAAGAYDRDAKACVTWLLDQGVSATAVTEDGESVLRGAGFVEVKALLVERGADPSEIDLDTMAPEDAERLRELLPQLAKKKRVVKKKPVVKATPKKKVAKKNKRRK